MKRKITLAVGSTLLCASILSGCASATPVDKYLRSFDKGDSEAASQIYSEEIKDSAEDKEALQTKLKERMDSIYEDFKAGKITSDEAKEKLKSYKEYDTSSVYAFTTINKVTTLQKSKDAYSDAEKAENDGNLADAITNYKSVIEDDPNHETAQAKVLQLSETYTETMKAQAQQEADSKDYDRAINTIALWEVTKPVQPSTISISIQTIIIFMSVPYSANVAVFKKIVLHWISSSQMIPAQSSQRAVTFSVCLEKDSMLLSLTNCSNCCEKMLWIIFETTV